MVRDFNPTEKVIIMTRTKIEIKNLYKVFGDGLMKAMGFVHEGVSKQELLDKHGYVTVLRNINIKSSGKKIQVIMGLSGSGKST